MKREISKSTLRRLPAYLRYLKSLDKTPENISATAIAEALALNEVQVRKDLASVSSGGKPKTGYKTVSLIDDLENFLGYADVNDAVIVGAGKLGRALMEYEGFRQYGFNIVAGFDNDESVISEENRIFHIDRLENLCKRLNVKIGIITVPEKAAQEICDRLVDCGILAVWNFAPVFLKAPENILVHNENMASSLAVLSNYLYSQISNRRILKK